MSTFPATADLPQSGSLVSRWLQDEASGTRADIVGSNTLADVNTVGAGVGFTDLGAAFDNSADYERDNSENLEITDGSQSGLDFSGDLSFGEFVKVESSPSNATRTIMSKNKTEGGDDFAYKFTYRDSGGTKTLRVGLSTNGTTLVEKGVTQDLTVGTFFHISFAYDASAGEVTFYVDGVKVGSTQTGYPTSLRNSAAAFKLGSDGGVASSPNNTWDGLMQDAPIWAAHLSDAEMLAFFTLYGTAPAAVRANAFFI